MLITRSRSFCIKRVYLFGSVFDLPMGEAAFPELSTQSCRKNNSTSSDVKKQAEHWRFVNAAIFSSSWSRQQWRLEELGTSHARKKCQMERKISGISEFPEKRTTSRGWPKFSKRFSGNFLFHSILNRNFRKFWSNGTRPKFRRKFNFPTLSHVTTWRPIAEQITKEAGYVISHEFLSRLSFGILWTRWCKWTAACRKAAIKPSCW